LVGITLAGGNSGPSGSGRAKEIFMVEEKKGAEKREQRAKLEERG